MAVACSAWSGAAGVSTPVLGRCEEVAGEARLPNLQEVVVFHAGDILKNTLCETGDGFTVEKRGGMASHRHGSLLPRWRSTGKAKPALIVDPPDLALGTVWATLKPQNRTFLQIV